MRHSGVSGDASPVATSKDYYMRLDMENAPLGKEILLINEGGKLVTGKLTGTNREHFIEWQYAPKRAKRGKKCS